MLVVDHAVQFSWQHISIPSLRYNIIVQEGKIALMLAKEARHPYPDVVRLLEEAVRNTAVTREQVNTFCSIVCNYTLRQPLPASGTK